MNQLKRLFISSAAVVLFSGVALAVPVSARDGIGTDDSSVSSTEVNAASGSESSSADDSSTGTGESNKLAEQFREMAKEKVQQAKENHKEQSSAQREKVCNVRKTNLTRRMSNAVTVANRHKENIDKIYTKVKDYYTGHQLDVTGYADLTAKVDTARAGVQTSIDALKALDINVDCTSQTVADSVSAFQQAVSNTRDSLKTYRSALVDLITALKGVSTSNNSGDTTDTTNGTNQ